MPRLPSVEQRVGFGTEARIEQTSAYTAARGIDTALESLKQKDIEDKKFEAIKAENDAQEELNIRNAELKDELSKTGDIAKYEESRKTAFEDVKSKYDEFVPNTYKDKFNNSVDSVYDRTIANDVPLISQIQAQSKMNEIERSFNLLGNEAMNGKMSLQTLIEKQEGYFEDLKPFIPVEAYNKYKTTKQSENIRNFLEVEAEKDPNTVSNKLISGAYDSYLTDNDKRNLINFVDGRKQAKLAALSYSGQEDGKTLTSGYQSTPQMTANLFTYSQLSKNKGEKQQGLAWAYLSKFSETNAGMDKTQLDKFVKENKEELSKDPTVMRLFEEAANERRKSLENMTTQDAAAKSNTPNMVVEITDPTDANQVAESYASQISFITKTGLGKDLSFANNSFKDAIQTISKETDINKKISQINELTSAYNQSSPVANTYLKDLKKLGVDDTTIGIAATLIDASYRDKTTKEEVVKTSKAILDGADIMSKNKNSEKLYNSSYDKIKKEVRKLIGDSDATRVDSYARNAFLYGIGKNGIDDFDDGDVDEYAKAAILGNSDSKFITDNDEIVPDNMDTSDFEDMKEKISFEYLSKNNLSMDKWNNFVYVEGAKPVFVNKDNIKELKWVKEAGKRNVYHLETENGTIISNGLGGIYYVSLADYKKGE